MKLDADVPFRRTLGLTLGALGVVFGDIGTSPLYAMRESALAVGGHAASHAAVFGALSLIFWALVIVVTVKYVVFIMRADNNGEGGVMALAALAHRAPVSRSAKTAVGIAALLGLIFYAAMAGGAYVVEIVFGLLNLIPTSRGTDVMEAGLSWDYTTFLNIAALILAAVLLWRFLTTGGPEMLRAMERPTGRGHAHHGSPTDCH